MIKLLKSFGWPAIAGLLAAGVILLLFPQLLNKNGPLSSDAPGTSFLSPAAEDNWSGPVSYSDAVERAAPAVVNIYTQTRVTSHPLLDDPVFRQFFNRSNLPQQQRMQSSLGSGVIISKEGYLLTNNHVVEGADQILVLLHDGREAKATLVGSDAETDLAVLKIDAPDLPPISVGVPSKAKVGDVVLAIGNPFGIGQSVSQGIVSATGRNGLGLSVFENFIQTDAAINPGNSGGALVDAYGNLLGINSAILDRSANSVGVGFAIPADMAIKVLEDIVRYGKVIRGWLGVEARTITPEAAARLGISDTGGLLVTGIARGGPADVAGLRQGDIIIRVDGTWVGVDNYTLRHVAGLAPGQPVKLEIWRQGEIQKIEAITGTRPQ